MEVFEPGTPVGGLQDGMHEGDDIHEGVTHQEEEVQHLSDLIDSPEEDGQLGDECCQEEAEGGEWREDCYCTLGEVRFSS